MANDLLVADQDWPAMGIFAALPQKFAAFSP
jgi:hypothetical protein